MAGVNYQEAWAQYRTRRKLVWLVPAGFMLASFGVRSLNPNAPLAFFVAGLIAYVALQAWLEKWQCPRCGQRFQRDGKVSNACAACGLEKWAPDNSARES